MTRFQNALATALLFWIIDVVLRWWLTSPIPLIVEFEVSILVACVAWMFPKGNKPIMTSLQRGIVAGVATIFFQILSVRGATSGPAVARAFVIVMVIVIVSSIITMLPVFDSDSQSNA